MRIEDGIWDAVVIGAGPAGGVSAALLAESGWRVLLLERGHWPREKVCGGCVNAAALQMLRDIGMASVFVGAASLDQFNVRVGKQKLSLALPEGAAMPRDEFDRRIVSEAVHRGCEFLSNASALVMPDTDSDGATRQIKVTIAEEAFTIHARVVLACDGIAGASLQHEPWAHWRVAPSARFGAAATLPTGPASESFARHATIGMHVGRQGYVGTARYADGRVHIAAALDPGACRDLGGPARVITGILGDSGMQNTAALLDARFRGAGLLTRRRAAVGGHRVLAVGDACGYVEPFTGEGIAWAIRGAREVVQLLVNQNARQEWSPHFPAQWEAGYRRTIRAQQRWCRALTQVVRYPRVAESTLSLINCLPAMRGMAELLARTIGASSFAVHPCAQGALHDPN